MIKKNIIKRACAGILAFLMVGTSYPVTTFASVEVNEEKIVESVEDSDDSVASVEEATEEILISDEDAEEVSVVKNNSEDINIEGESLEEEYWTVNLDIENIRSIDYVFGAYDSISDSIIVSKDEGDLVDDKGNHFYNIRNLRYEKKTSIAVPKTRPYLIVLGTDSLADDADSAYAEPIVVRQGHERLKINQTQSNIYYNDTKHTKIYDCYAFGIDSNIDYDYLSDTDINRDQISIKCKKIQHVDINIENIESFEYTIVENLNRVCESFGTARITPPGSIRKVFRKFTNSKTVFTADVPYGYSLVIWNIERKYKDTHDEPVVIWGDNELDMVDAAISIYENEGEADVPTPAYVFPSVDEAGKELKDITIKSVRLYNFSMKIDDKKADTNLKKFSYLIVSPEEKKTSPVRLDTATDRIIEVEEGGASPVDFDFDDLKNDTDFVWDLKDQTGERVPEGSYLYILNVETKSTDSSYAFYENGILVPEQGNLVICEDDPTTRYKGYVFKLDSDKSDVEIRTNDIYKVTIDLDNISSLTYVIAEDLQKIPELEIKTEREPFDDPFVINLPKGYSLILIDAKEKSNIDYYKPEVSINGEVKKLEYNIGTIKEVSGGTRRLDGYMLAKAENSDITGIKIAAAPKAHSVKVATYYGEELTYVYAKSADDVRDAVKAYCTGGALPEDAVVDTVFVNDGVNNVADVPLGYYFAIIYMSPNKGCYGDYKVTDINNIVEEKKVEIGRTPEDEPIYQKYYLVGAVNADITTLRADVIEEAYDVVIFTQDVKELSYIVADGYDGKAKIEDVVTVPVTPLDPGDYDPDDLSTVEDEWLNSVAYGDAYECYKNYEGGSQKKVLAADVADDRDKKDFIYKDQVPLKTPFNTNKPDPSTAYGYVKVHAVPKGKVFVVTDYIKRTGGTEVDANSFYINGKLVSATALGTYFKGEKFVGVTLGTVGAPFPTYQLDRVTYEKPEEPKHDEIINKKYKIGANLAIAESDNYKLEVNLKNGPDVKIGYKAGHFIKKSTSGQDYTYANVSWNEGKTDYITEDLVFELKSKSINYDVFVYNKETEVYELRADVYARAFRIDGKGNTYYSDAKNLNLSFINDPSDTYAGCFVIDKDIIYDWLEGPGKWWTNIEIEVKPFLEITYPTEEDDKVEVYLYDENLRTVEDYKEEAETNPEIKIDPAEWIGDTTKGRFGDNVRFVVVPIGDVIDVENYAYNFVVDSVTEKSNFPRFTRQNYPNYPATDNNGYIRYFYQLSNIDRDITIRSTIRTQTAGVKFTLVNKTELAAGNQFGKAVFDSKDVKRNSSDAATATYKYSLVQNVTDVTITIREEKEYAQLEFLFDDVEIEPKSHVKGVYTFVIPAKEFMSNPTITLNNKWLTKEFYTIYNPDQVEITITAKGATVAAPTEMESAFEDGYNIYLYQLPANEKSLINVKAKPNCKVEYVLVKNSKKQPDYAGNIEYYVSDDNSPSGMDFVVRSEALKTLYFGEPICNDDGELVYDYDEYNEEGKFTYEPHLKNTYTVEVSKEKPYSAYIRFGDPDKIKLPVSDTDLSNIKVTAKVGSVDYTNSIVEVKDDVMYLTFANPSSRKEIAGKTVVLTVKEGTKTLATLNMKVTPYATTATIKGEKNNILTHDLLSDKTYDVSFNKGVKSEDILAVFQYQDDSDDWTTFTNNIDGTGTDWFTVDGKKYRFFEYDAERSKFTIRANPDVDLDRAMAKMPTMQVLFYDTTDPDYDKDSAKVGESKAGLFATKTINIKALTLEKFTPAVKVTSATDLDINLDITAPKSYVTYWGGRYLTGDDPEEDTPTKPGLYYVIKARAQDNGRRPDQMLEYKIICVPATGLNTTAKLSLGKPGIDAGEGDEWKYDVNVQAYYGLAPKLASTGIDYEFSPEYGVSKAKVLKKLATKAPYHETKLGVTAKNNKFYQDQKNVNVGKAKFSKQTTFYDLTFKLTYPDGEEVTGVKIRQGNKDEDNSAIVENAGEDSADIFIVDSASLEPGDYILYVYPDPASSAAVLPITVYESIKAGGFSIVLPSDEMYRKDGATATMTAKVVYEKVSYWSEHPEIKKYPKTQKVTWSIEKAPGASVDFDITKYVSVQATTGKVTVSKSFVRQEKRQDNQFVLVATAADFAGAPVRKVSSEVVTINNYYSDVDELIPHKGITVIPKNSNGKYQIDSSAIDRIDISGAALARNCEIKSSNSKVIEIVGVNSGNPKAFDIKVNGLGKAKITVTSLDGGKSKAQVEIEIVPKSFSSLGIRVGSEELDATADNELSISSIHGEKVVILGDGADIDASKGFTNYTLTLSGGAKIINFEGERYLDITGPVFTFKLTDKTKPRSSSEYQKSYVVKLDDYDYDANGKPLTQNITAGLKSTSVLPIEGTLVKLGGLKYKLEDAPYDIQVEFVPDLASSLNLGETYFGDFETALDDDSMFDGGVNFTYNDTLKAFVPDLSDPVDALRPMSGTPNNNYKYVARVYRDGVLVNIKPVSTIKMKAAPKPAYGIKTSYSTTETGKEDIMIQSIATKCKNILGDAEVIMISDASINGKVDIKATECFSLASGNKLEVNDISGLSGNVVYCNVTYVFCDYYGKKYEKTEMIEILIRH